MQKKPISKQKTSFAISVQISACRKRLPLATTEKAHYALSNKIKNLEKQLLAAKQFEWLAQ